MFLNAFVDHQNDIMIGHLLDFVQANVFIHREQVNAGQARSVNFFDDLLPAFAQRGFHGSDDDFIPSLFKGLKAWQERINNFP